MKKNRCKPDLIRIYNGYCFKVRITGVEPAPSCPDQHLKLARLPIPPYPHTNHMTFNIISHKFQFVKSFLKIFSEKFKDDLKKTVLVICNQYSSSSS